MQGALIQMADFIANPQILILVVSALSIQLLLVIKLSYSLRDEKDLYPHMQTIKFTMDHLLSCTQHTSLQLPQHNNNVPS